MADSQSIVKMTATLFAKYGIKSVSINDVSSLSGISKKTFYEHMENKDDLVRNVVDFNLNKFVKKLSTCLNKEKNIFSRLCCIYAYTIKDLAETNPSYVYDLKKYYFDQYNRIIQFRDEKMYSLVSQLIEEGVKEGIFREGMNIRYVYFNQVHKLSALSWDSSAGMIKTLSPKDIYLLLINDIRGLTTLKGHEILDREYNKLAGLI